MFFYTHVVAAAQLLFSPNCTDSVTELAKLVVATFVYFRLNDGKETTKGAAGALHGVHLYARETIALGLLYYGFYDATNERD